MFVIIRPKYKKKLALYGQISEETLYLLRVCFLFLIVITLRGGNSFDFITIAITTGYIFAGNFTFLIKYFIYFVCKVAK